MRRSMGAGKLRITYLNQRLRRGSRRSFSGLAATPSDLLDLYLGCCTRHRRTSTARRYQVGHIRLPAGRQLGQGVRGVNIP